MNDFGWLNLTHKNKDTILRGIGSSEQDVTGMVANIEARIGEARNSMSRLRRLIATVGRRDFSLRQKWNHHWMMKRRAVVKRHIEGNIDPCIRPWYSLTVRTDGTIPVCCARQERIIGDLETASLPEIWNGPQFAKLRTGMRRVIVEDRTA